MGRDHEPTPAPERVGAELARRATLQARKVRRRDLQRPRGLPGLGGFREIALADGQRVRGRCVVLAPGADYRRLPAENADRFEG
jgi:thioredoxin reductase (NADPH)